MAVYRRCRCNSTPRGGALTRNGREARSQSGAANRGVKREERETLLPPFHVRATRSVQRPGPSDLKQKQDKTLFNIPTVEVLITIISFT